MGVEPGKLLRRSFEKPMELLRMLALLAGSVGLLRAAVTTTESSTTIKAVPLNDKVDEGLRQEEEEDESSTTETESLGTIPTTTSTSTTNTEPTTSIQAETTTSHTGLIKRAPYRGPSEDRKKGGKIKTKEADFPKLRPVKGRWISRDKAEAKLLNVRPGFIYPEMEVGDYPVRKEGNGKIREKRHSGEAPDGSVVAVCGGTFRDLYGVIQSPDYPLYYPNNKKCTFDIEVPENHTLKLTCDRFMMQGGQNCSHDFMMVDFTGDTMFANGQKFCGLDPPSLVSNGTRMTVMFQSDDLFRYQGFSCR